MKARLARKLAHQGRDIESGLYAKFYYAAISGNRKRMKEMLRKGFDVNEANEQGETAFSWCCQNNRLKSAQFLYKNGADVNVSLIGYANPYDPSAPREIATPLDIAMCWSSPYFRRWLKSVGGIRNKNFEGWSWPRADKMK